MSKTKLGVKTAFAVVLIALIQGILSFYRVNVLIFAYGDKVNGIVQVALQLSAYLILFQSGMSAAYQFKMYEPVAKGEYPRISSLFTGLKRSMQRVSGKMLLISLLVIPTYSLLLLNQGIQYVDTLLILAAIGVRITVPYFFTLPERCLIDIREKKYIVIAVEGAKDIVSLFAEILLIKFTKLPLPLILCVNLVFLAISKLIYIGLVKKYYGKSFSLKAAPEYAPTDMTRAVYAHQVSSIVTSNTDNVVVSLFSLQNVTVMSSFSTLISYPVVVISRIIEGMRASLALKITREDADSYAAYRELLAFSLFCICAIIPVFLQMANPFVVLWLPHGSQYCIGPVPLILFALILADNLIMPVIYAARDARGLYQESKKYAILQAIVNVVLSFALVIPLGITGVLLGTFAALYLVLQPGNFKLVYNTVFKRKTAIYTDLLLTAALCALSFFAGDFVLTAVWPAANAGWLVFIQKALICTAISVLFGGVGLFAFHEGFRQLARRFLKLKKGAHAA